MLPHPWAGAMRARILTIILMGITIGILLGMSVIALLRAFIEAARSADSTAEPQEARRPKPFDWEAEE